MWQVADYLLVLHYLLSSQREFQHFIVPNITKVRLYVAIFSHERLRFSRWEIINMFFSDAHAEHHEYADFGDAGDHEDHEHEEHQHDEVHQYVGLALLTGFLLMLMIDNIGGEHGHSHGADGHGHGSTLVAEKNIER